MPWQPDDQPLRQRDTNATAQCQLVPLRSGSSCPSSASSSASLPPWQLHSASACMAIHAWCPMRSRTENVVWRWVGTALPRLPRLLGLPRRAPGSIQHQLQRCSWPISMPPRNWQLAAGMPGLIDARRQGPGDSVASRRLVRGTSSSGVPRGAWPCRPGLTVGHLGISASRGIATVSHTEA